MRQSEEHGEKTTIRNYGGDICAMKERYEGIDGLKAYVIIGIALMHIQSNGKFILPGVYLQELVS